MATYVLHDSNSLLGLSDELILGLLNLLLGLRAKFLLLAGLGALGALAELESVALGMGLHGIEAQPGLLDILASTGRKVQVGVERRIPARQEALLDLRVLRKASLTHALRGQGVLLEPGGQGVLAGAGVVLVQHLAAG
jgi:hypothetical protein